MSRLPTTMYWSSRSTRQPCCCPRARANHRSQVQQTHFRLRRPAGSRCQTARLSYRPQKQTRPTPSSCRRRDAPRTHW
eukprot:6014984-Prymnesium_polylepis.1